MAGSVADEREYSVSIEAEGDGWQGHEGDADRLIEVLDSHPVPLHFATSWGGLAGGPGVTLTLTASSPVLAGAAALEIFEKALVEIGLGPVRVARLDVMTDDYLDAELSQPVPEFVGVAEVAAILGVSKQRVSELRRRRDFPRPVAELASGPVWNRTSLNHFIAGWERKPGRPRFVSGTAPTRVIRKDGPHNARGLGAAPIRFTPSDRHPVSKDLKRKRSSK